MSDEHAPVGGPPLSQIGFFRFLLAVVAIGGVITAWRFAVGLGPSTGLSDGYPWGLWIALEVVTGTALACGGYAMALLVYIFNQGRYHPLVRPAILTSALGYSIAAVAIMVDVGRPWFIWKIPIAFGKYNWNSALLEVALCVMAYVFVLWVELSPAFLEKWRDSRSSFLQGLSRAFLPIINKLLVFIIALGILLPTMHQSSLGTVMLLANQKLHPLWNTGLIPLLFLISCIAMGYAAVVFEGVISSLAFKRKPHTAMLARLYMPTVITVLIFLVIRFADIVIRGHLGTMFRFDLRGIMFWIEALLFLVPVFMLLSPKRNDLGHLFRAAIFLMLAGALYRFDAYIVAFMPPGNWTYFPSVTEMLISAGMIAAEIMFFVILVKYFPILGGTPARAES
jgi:Ni/Fe-hydrogenase subunit HybB-like protein